VRLHVRLRLFQFGRFCHGKFFRHPQPHAEVPLYAAAMLFRSANTRWNTRKNVTVGMKCRSGLQPRLPNPA
jgi:hypothetical protein